MKRFFIILALFAVAACDRDEGANDVRICGDYEVTMEFPADMPDTLRAVLNGDAVDLELAPSASGARYVGVLNDTTVTLWQKGDEWTLMLDDDMIVECGGK